MNLSRREAALFTAVAMVAPTWARAEAPPPPIFFVDPGAKAPSRAAYEDAIAKGADFLTAPIAASSDGGLVVAPGNELSVFTDVAARADFAGRRKDRTADGVAVNGWFSEDFTLAELRTLLTGPARSAGRALAAPPTLLSLQEVIDIARSGSVGAARVVGVSPRIIRAAYSITQDINPGRSLADIIRLAGYDSPAAAMIVQAHEPAALQAFGEMSRARRLQLIDAEGGPADPAALRYHAMINPDGLKTVSGWARAIGPAESLLIQPGPKGAILTTGLAQAAREAGVAVYARAAAPGAHEAYGAPRARLMALFLAGANGVMCADVAMAAKARADVMDRLRQRRS